MRHRLAIVLTVIGAIALPVVMAATVLYASNAAIGGSDEPLTPQFGTTSPADDHAADARGSGRLDRRRLLDGRRRRPRRLDRLERRRNLRRRV